MNCPRCSEKMKIVERSDFPNELLKKPFFYVKWYKCQKCGQVVHNKRWKIQLKDRNKNYG